MKRYISGAMQYFSLIMVLLLTANSYPQQLINTFTKINSNGDTEFGYSVASAGDVNGDGYDDIIVGGPTYINSTGRAYIYYGGTNMDEKPDVTLTGEAANTYFGSTVAGAGDVNGDGYDDVIVGAKGYNSFTGQVYIYYGGKAMDDTADVILTGEMLGEYFGYSVAGIGDVNNDGYDDIIVGATGYSQYTGRAYVYYGGKQMDNTADLTMTGENTGDYFSEAVAGAGDINHDGYDDIIIGAHNFSSSTGRVYIYYGAKSMDNTPDVILNGKNTNDHFGWSVAGAGDVNGDGFADVIIGAYGYDSNTGRAYVYYGGSSMTDTADAVFTGEKPGDYFGSSVSGAGDVNKDGFDDAVVGAYGFESNTGRAYVYYGGNTTDSTADVILTGETKGDYFGCSVAGAGDLNKDGFDDLIIGAYNYYYGTGHSYLYYGKNNMNSTPDITLNGELDANFFGCSVASAGDVNKDGYDDIIVGNFGNSFLTGRAFIYYGGNPMSDTAAVVLKGEGPLEDFGYSVAGAGDVNGDGYADVAVGAPNYNSNTGRVYIYYGGKVMDDTADVILNGQGTNYFFGHSVSGAGDVNKDGYADVIVGAYNYYYAMGRAYIYYGGSKMKDTPDVTLTGEGTSNSFGWSVSGAGDFNGDGYADVIVGAPDYGNVTGRAYIYYGGSQMDDTADVTLTGEQASSSFGFSVSGAGDVNKDGYSDVIIGSPGYNSNQGRAYVYYGGKNTDNLPDADLTGETIGSFFGLTVSGAGDVNKDGYTDLIIGASGYNDNTGGAYVYYGGNPMDTTADIKMTGEYTNDYYGYSVSGAGDVNGDGYADLLVGDPNYGSNNGKTYLYSGFNKPSAVKQTALYIPSRFILKQNYPNPFNPSTIISYVIPKAEYVTLKVYNILGKEVTTLVNSEERPGNYEVTFDGGPLASGIYFYRLQAGSYTESKKMILMK